MTETENDKQLKQIKEYCEQGWPKDKSKCKENVKKFYKMSGEIYLEDGILLYNDRIIVPNSIKKKMLDQLQETHLGIVKSKKRAMKLLYWPGINTTQTLKIS